MNSKKSFINLILLSILFTITINAQQVDSVYNFPLKPGMSSWKKFQTHKEMLTVLQIPGKILTSLSSSALVKTCLDYPLFSDMWAYDNIKVGFEQLRKEFNGFNELFGRNDAFDELFKLYSSIDPNSISEKGTTLEKGKYTAKICKIEILLAQLDLLQGVIQVKKNLLLKEILKKHEAMLKYNEFDIRSIESNIFLMGNVLVNTDLSMMAKISKNAKINNFLKTSRFIEKDIILEIISLSTEYLNNQL
jgi:hypothetical protein